MPDRLKAILEKIKEWWLKFTTKQKTLLISITAVVILALVILAVVMTKPTMVQLITCEDATQASSVKDLLDGNSIDYEVSSDGMTFSVNAKNQADANILLGSNSIPTNGFTIDDALSGSISTTEADKSKRYQVFLEDKFAKELENMDLIKSADVNLNIPEDDGTLVTRNQESYASVKLELNGEMSEDQAASLARYIATEIGNSSTDNITIIDSNSNLLFAGGEESTAIGTASTQLSYQTKKETQVKKAVTDVIKGTDLYDTIDVGLNLKLNFDQVTTNETNYSAQGDRDEGLITHEDRYQSDSTGGTSGTPGTDSNGDGTTYVLPDGSTSESSVTDDSIDRALDEKNTQTIGSVGDIEYDQSSISVTVARYVTYNEDTLKADGTLDNMTFDEFVTQNNNRVKGTVDQDLYTMVSNATGIPASNISIVSYDIPMFEYSKGSGRGFQDYLQIILAVLIFALLGYVVFRSTRKEKETEIEPELSVESLLETTKQAEQEDLEDIGYNEISESRVLIEIFVDENPDAVASLLRNWLNEEWE